MQSDTRTTKVNEKDRMGWFEATRSVRQVEEPGRAGFHDDARNGSRDSVCGHYHFDITQADLDRYYSQERQMRALEVVVSRPPYCGFESLEDALYTVLSSEDERAFEARVG